MTTNIKKMTCEFIEITSIVPASLTDDFWADFSSDAPFSFGDNDRTLVTAERVLEHCKFVCETDTDEMIEFLDLLKSLGDTYIDIEN
jgi:hypothetical protein